jgi:thioredoxin reductase
MKNVAEYMILGAGPAGMQMAYFLEKAGRDYLVLERGDRPGTFFRKLPRHRKLISVNKIYTGHTDLEKNLRWDWNSLLCDSEELLFNRYTKRYWPSADDLVRYLGDFAAHYDLKVQYGADVVHIARDAEGFSLKDAQGTVYRAKRLIVASGVSKPFIPAIPGVELAENYVDISLNPDDFAGQRILILGKGNSAFEMAELLNETTALLHVCSPHPIKMAWNTHHVGHLRALNNNLLDTYQLKLQNGVLDAEVRKIERRGDKLVATFEYAHAEGEVEEIAYDRIVVCTGFRLDHSIFDASASPELAINGRFPALTSAWESTNVPGLYFAGTLMQSLDFKKVSSGFIHGFRYNIRALHWIFEARYHGAMLPFRALEPTPEAATEAVLASANRSSAIWQQFGFLGDVVHAPTEGPFSYYEALPVAYVHDTLMAKERRYFVITLEYGKPHAADVFHAPRIHKDDAERGHLSQGLHPVIRCYNMGRLVAEHHTLEDLETAWNEDVHIKPLLAFFQKDLAAPPASEVVASM